MHALFKCGASLPLSLKVKQLKVAVFLGSPCYYFDISHIIASENRCWEVLVRHHLVNFTVISPKSLKTFFLRNHIDFVVVYARGGLRFVCRSFIDIVNGTPIAASAHQVKVRHV